MQWHTASNATSKPMGSKALKNSNDPHSTLRSVSFESAEVSARANKRHPLNALISEYDWQRSQEAARLAGFTSVSDIVRTALDEFLSNHERAGHLHRIAEMTLELEVKADKERDSLSP